MKRYILLLGILSVFALPLCACNSDKGTSVLRIDASNDYLFSERVSEPLPDDLTNALKIAYNEFYPFESDEQFSVDKIEYFGEYNGAHIVYPIDMYPCFQSTFFEAIDGVVFLYCNSISLDVYFDGTIYKLRDAYNNGFLSHDDLLSIRHKFCPNYDDTALISGLPLTDEDYNSPEYAASTK